MRLVGVFARGTAIAIAAAGAIDPSVSLPRLARPAVRVSSTTAESPTRLSAVLRNAGFAIGSPERETATVVVTDRVAAAARGSGPVWILDASAPAPNARIADSSAAAARLPGQALDIRVLATADGLSGTTSELLLEDSGILVASAHHRWSSAHERWDAVLQYLPPTDSGGRLRVRLTDVPGESSTSDNVADVPVPPVRGPVRTLIIEAAVTWPALFVRRALEGESAFRVSTVQRASKGITTRAGGPPSVLTRNALSPYEVAIVGGEERLTAAEIDALRWFVEVRGGVVMFIPDQQPNDRYGSLLGASAFESRVLESAVQVGSELRASELVIPRGLPAAAVVLAADPSGNPVVVSLRRGAGAVIFSGALDAWRHRGQDDDAFARFWRGVVAADAIAVPPALDVSVEPALAQPGEHVRVIARARETELTATAGRVEIQGVMARVVNPVAKTDEAVRLWPTAEPGVFSGDWRAVAGQHNISVSAGTRRGDAAVMVAADVVHASPLESADLSRFARASGGQSFPAGQIESLVTTLASSYPAQRVVQPGRPMRSPWWCVPFAALLCADWIIRRRRGFP